MFRFLRKNDITNPPWNYYFLLNLDEKYYPKYLSKIFKLKTGENLNLKHPKTFNQKIQWLKLYDSTPLKRDCTDKIKVRDYVKEHIGEEYLKPILGVYDSFDEIDFKNLPETFMLKCNHGCKWHYFINNKSDYLNTPKLVEDTKRQITGWMEQEFWPWVGFEMQYKGIQPKILIEPMMREDNGGECSEIEIYCFNGIPKILSKVRYRKKREISCYDDNFNQIDLIFHPDGKNITVNEKADDFVKQAAELSKKLAGEFKLVRVDWMIHNNKLYFEELTFTPYSGLVPFDKKWEEKLGNLIKL